VRFITCYTHFLTVTKPKHSRNSMGNIITCKYCLSALLMQLHWLPVHYCIQFKLARPMHMAQTGQSPLYIRDVIMLISWDSSCHQPCFTDTTDYAVPMTRTKFRKKAFCVAEPSVWNSPRVAVQYRTFLAFILVPSYSDFFPPMWMT